MLQSAEGGVKEPGADSRTPSGVRFSEREPARDVRKTRFQEEFAHKASARSMLLHLRDIYTWGESSSC